MSRTIGIFPTAPRRTSRPFTGMEVRRLLAHGGDDPRSRAARRCAARVADWQPQSATLPRCPARYRPQLARLVFWAMCGDSLSAIAPRVDGWLIANRLPDPGLALALLAAHRQIAAQLNRASAQYGL